MVAGGHKNILTKKSKLGGAEKHLPDPFENEVIHEKEDDKKKYKHNSIGTKISYINIRP